MKVLIDYQVFSWQKYGGISRYFSNLVKHFSNDICLKLPILISNNNYIKDSGFSLIDWSSKDFRGKIRASNYINKFYSKKVLDSSSFDLFHPTYYDNYFLKHIKGRPFVLTVHDMIHELYPDIFQRTDKTCIQKEELIKKSAAIIAVSENTKKDILKICDVEPSKISVIYHGFDKIKDFDSQRIINDDYILYVGDRSGYKNFTRLLESFMLLSRIIDNIKLVCAGRSFSKDELLLLKKYSIEEKVIIFDASDKILNNLYRNAIFFIYPSIYEGFGIPILEAFSNSCPVVASNNSCFPEIGQDAALYFDPFNVNDIRDCMITVYTNKELRHEMIQKGHKRLEMFCWKRAALETEQVYKRIV